MELWGVLSWRGLVIPKFSAPPSGETMRQTPKSFRSARTCSRSSNTMWQGPRSTSIPSAILIHVAVWSQQTWAENWGLSCNTMWPGPRPTTVQSGILIHAAVWPQHVGQNWGCCAWAKIYLRTKWHLNPSSCLATTDMDQKLGLCPFCGGRAGSPSKTLWPGPRPTSMPSFILIHPTVWPQYSNVTDRQRSDSIWRTVLQTVVQKHTGRNMIRMK